jgi:hypothetical protein
VTVVCLFLVFALSTHTEGASIVFKSSARDVEEFSPYFAAFSENDRSRIAEYERLKRSLMYFKVIDWDAVVQPRITDDEESSS